MSLLVRIVDDNFQHEAVELRLGQRVGAFLLDGVLRGHHQERLFQLVRGFADGDLAFLHGFEQGALHLGRGAVYFIRQDEVGENRSFLDGEFLRLLAVNHGAYHVGRQQVGRELDAVEVCLHQVGQRLDGQCLGQARHPFEQDVPVREQAYQQRVHQVLLPHDDLVHAHDQRIHESTLLLNAFIKFSNIN